MSRFSGMPVVILCAIIVVSLVSPIVDGASDPRWHQAPLNLGGGDYSVRGPYSHQNLSIYLIVDSAKRKARKPFLSLEEGLRSGKVRITEHENATVSSVLVYNRSELPLYLQEGQRISGGQQDRIFVSPLVIAPKTGPVVVPCMCVEQSRWSGKRVFGGTTSQLLAPRRVRLTASLGMSQSGVWSQVSDIKALYAKRFRTANSNSNLNQSLESPVVARALKPYLQGLSAANREIANALGVGVAINGKVQEINLWTNASIMKQMYPKLLRTYAMEAVVFKKEQTISPLSLTIAAFLTQKGERKRVDTVNKDNQVEVRSTADSVISRTFFKGQAIRLQWVPLEEGITISESARQPLDGSKAPKLPENFYSELSPVLPHPEKEGMSFRLVSPRENEASEEAVPSPGPKVDIIKPKKVNYRTQRRR